MKKDKTNSRSLELDMARGIATLVMVAYHISWDINYFVKSFEMSDRIWEFTAYPIASSFLFIVGISSFLESKQIPSEEKKRKYTLKILRTLLAASAITISSLFFMKDRPIYFGILHCILASYFLVGFFIHQTSNFILTTALLFIAVGMYFCANPLQAFPFFWLVQSDFKIAMSDYLPLMPWFGIVLLGTFVGKKISPAIENKIKSKRSHSTLQKSLAFIGRHSLFIYLFHQPIMMGILTLLGYDSPIHSY